MQKNTLFYGSLIIAGLAIFGFGCNSNQSPVALDKYQVQEQQNTEPQTQNQVTSTESAATSTQEVATTSTADGINSDLIKPNSTSTQNTITMEPEQPTKPTFPGVLSDLEVTNKQVRIKTTKGDIVFELLPKEGPKAASNFYYLVNRKFYDGLTFHRVEPGFVIQGGDPLGNGTGGPGYKFEDDKVNLSYNEGIVAMANSGPNTNGSQFFIMLADTPLPPSYSIFGRVTSGMDVVKKIAVGDKMTSVTVEPLKK